MHELEQDGTGRTAFVSGSNLDPWHRLGTVLPGGLTADEALEHAYLYGHDVRKVPILTTLEQITEDGVTTEQVEVPGQFALVRNNPFTKIAEVLAYNGTGAVVGKIYEAYQVEQAVEFLSAITDEYSDARFETAGSMRGGTEVFVSMKLDDFLIGGADGISQYLVYLLKHTTGANVAYATNVRPVCANTVEWGLTGARYTFRHSASIGDRHQQAREALAMSFNYQAKFQAEAESLLAVPHDLDEFRKVCAEIWPLPEDEAPDAVKKRWATRQSQLRQLFLFADTQEDIRFTRWGALNAIVEYQDHVAPVRGTTDAARAEARALRTVDGGGNTSSGVNVKAKAFELLKV